MGEANHHEFLKRFLREEPLLRSFLLSATGNVDATEELLQIIAVALWEKWAEFDSARPLRPWALGMARLEVLKWRQQLARRKETLSPEAVERLAEAAAEYAQEIDTRYRFLVECLETLKGEARNILEMKYGQGLKISQIASRSGKSVEAVEMMLVRIRRILRECIDRKAAEAEGGVA